MLNLSDQTPTAICRRDSSFCRAGGAEVASATVKEARSKAMVMVIFMGGMDQFTRQIVSKLHLSLAERCDEPRLRLAGHAPPPPHDSPGGRGRPGGGVPCPSTSPL